MIRLTSQLTTPIDDSSDGNSFERIIRQLVDVFRRYFR